MKFSACWPPWYSIHSISKRKCVPTEQEWSWFIPAPSQALFIISGMFRNGYWGDLPDAVPGVFVLVWKDLTIFLCQIPLVLLLPKPQDRLDGFSVSLVRNFFFKFSSLIPLCLSHLCFKRHSKVSGHQMFGPSDIVCNPLPLSFIFYLKKKNLVFMSMNEIFPAWSQWNQMWCHLL